MIWDDTLGANVEQGKIDFATLGPNVVIPGKVNQVIRVLGFFYIVSAASTLQFFSELTPLSGLLEFPSAGAHVQDYLQLPITCNEDDDFIINSSVAVQVGGMIWWIWK
jgi:hypothetical protein